jgi:hypothetical protein
MDRFSHYIDLRNMFRPKRNSLWLGKENNMQIDLTWLEVLVEYFFVTLEYLNVFALLAY